MDQGQITVALRYVGTAIGTILSVALAVGVLTPDQQATLGSGLQEMLKGLQETVHGFYTIFPVVVTVGTFWLGKLGWNSSKLSNMLKSIASHPEAPADVKTAAAAAVAK